MGEGCNTGSDIDYRARAPLVCAIAAAGIQGARVRSAIELLCDFVYGLRDAGKRTDREAALRTTQAGEKRFGSGGQRADRTDCVLPGSRRAGTDSIGAAGRRTVVESGVRSSGIQKCISRGN